MPPETQHMASLEQEILDTRSLQPGDDNYRAYVGPPAQYDFMGATQFRLLTALGLREDHHLIDIGCGSLRAGRLLLQYLLPGHYTGVEPNAWLWQQALEREIGADVQARKAPHFSTESDFQLADLADASADFIIAQSIYSHTGLDLFATSLQAAARCLSPQGQFLFTAILPGPPGMTAPLPSGEKLTGWLYPDCTCFTQQSILDACAAADLQVQRLAWYHPRQIWFRATASADHRLTAQMKAQLGTGKPLFDSRF